MKAILILIAALLVTPTTRLRAAESETASTPIPFSEIGAKATADYKGDALGITASVNGARLRTGFPKLSGPITCNAFN